MVCPMRSRVLRSAYLLLVILATCGLNEFSLRAAEWPTYRHDASRSGTTSESLALPLREAWSRRSPYRPQPAWDEPATWDGWNKVYNLKNRQTFDKAWHVVAADDAAYYGSSVDDKIYCVDAATGATRWAFYTEGPVRMAPTLMAGRLYVGSDDGHVYCLSAADGQLVWKRRLGPTDRRLPGNGRMISVWPVRTGTVVMDDTVYCSAGVFPHETVFVAALDAATGEVRWQTEMNDYPAQGYLLASATRLYVTTGRDQPLVFDRQSGERLYQVRSGVGGTYALLTGDTLFYGPGKTGQVTGFDAERKDQVAAFDGNHMIVSGRMSYLHTDTELSALDRPRYLELSAERIRLAGRRGEVADQLKKAAPEEAGPLKDELAELRTQYSTVAKQLRESILWNVKCDLPHCLILAGNHLWAGGNDEVAAYDVQTGEELWRHAVEGRVYGLAVSEGRLYVSTDDGVVHCFAAARQTASR